MPIFNKSLEALRRSGRPEFDVEELFKLHQRCEVIARCKVQASEDHLLVILVIAGETVRARHCDTPAQVNAIATDWKIELVSQNWHPYGRPHRARWRAQHQQWQVFASDRDGHYGAVAFSHADLVGVSGELTIQCAQKAILRKLADEFDHTCSECEPWSLDIMVPSDL